MTPQTPALTSETASPLLPLAIIDSVVFFGCFYLSLNFSLYSSSSIAAPSNPPLLIYALTFAAVMSISMFALGLYKSQSQDKALRALARTGVGIVVGYASLASFVALIPLSKPNSESFLIAAALSFFTISTIRHIYLDIARLYQRRLRS
jgi:FlaA1/EpsC-like NDP-sugar epimerase